MFKNKVQSKYKILAEGKIYYHGRSHTRPYRGKYIYITDSLEYASRYNKDDDIYTYSLPFNEKEKIFSITNKKHLDALKKYVDDYTIEQVKKSSGEGEEIDWAALSYISTDDYEEVEDLLKHIGFYGVRLKERTGVESIYIFDESKLKFIGKVKPKYITSSTKPRVFYRGINPGESKRIKTGNDVWDSYLFACDSPEKAKWYGEKIIIIKAKPSAKILYEKTPEFNKIAKTIKKGKNLLDFSVEVTEKAKKLGYHAVWFERQTDIGTVMMVPSEFIVERG